MQNFDRAVTIYRARCRALALGLATGAALATGACNREPDHGPGLRIMEALSNAPDSGAVLVTMLGDTVPVSSATLEFYRERRFNPAWTEGEEVLERGHRLHEVLGRSAEDGLFPTQYHHDAAARLIAAWEADNASSDEETELDEEEERAYLGDLDVLLTEGFARYANDLVTGTVDPQAAGIDWRIPRGRVPESRALADLEKGIRPERVVEALRPQLPYYRRAMEALARYRAAAEAGGWPGLPEDVALKPGDSGPAVAALRERLARGIDPTEAELAKSGSGDTYDEKLVEAVKHFQQRHGIEPDGAVGAGTLAELNHTVEERIAELRLNMDRWRWLPSKLGRKYVLVNVAGFELEVVEDEKVLESMNVVVGQEGWTTPIFADTMEFLVVNPYWNVPQSIFEDEIRPAMERDPSYLARNNMEFVDGRVRQRPGPGNALGDFKFLFPNKNNIYLHDTPADHLFSRTRRDFSHGCIRLERPEDMARLIMKIGADRDPDEIARLRATGTEQWVKLKDQIPVYILYFTTWVEEDGTVRFHHDIYGRDKMLEQQRREKLEEDIERADPTRIG